MKKKKQKKIGNGFGLRLTQFILYLLFLLLFVAGGITLFQNDHSNSFVDWLKCTQYNGSKNSDSKVDLDANGIYDDQCTFLFISYWSEQELNVGSGENRVTYNFTSEDMGLKEFTCTNEETGETLTIKYSQIQVYEKFVSLGGWRAKEDIFVFSGLVGGALLFGLFALLQALATFLGKKSVKANNLSIVINSITVIFLGLGAFGLAGGIKGKKYLRSANLKGQSGTTPAGEQTSDEIMSPQSDGVQTALVSELTELEKADCKSQSAEIIAEPAVEEEVTEYIQPKMGAKGKKIIMAITIASYALLLLMGILLSAVPSMSKILCSLGICKEWSARAYGITIGVMWCALTPAIGFYFATVSPLNNKKVKIIIAVVSAILLVAMNVVFFIIINTVKGGTDSANNLYPVKRYFEGSDTWFIPVSMIFASLGLIICPLLTLFKINPAKIKNKKPEKCGDGLFEVIKHVFALLIYGISCLVKIILTAKEKQPEIFVLISTILLTWLAHFVSFVFAIICIAVLISVIAMYFTGVISWAYTPGSGSKSTLTVNGKTVTEQPYIIDDRYQKVYKDEYGNEYVSDDGGKTAREYHRYDDE